jgi:hypothetical protein
MDEFDKTRKKLFEKALSRKRTCILPECNRPAIQSHIIQRRGVLSEIISDNHLYEVSFLQYPNLHYIIKRVGWKNAMTFPGLCAVHDSSLFNRIERDQLNYEDYKTLLLLSFRPMLHELRIKQIVTEVFGKIGRHPLTAPKADPISIRVAIEAETLTIWDLEYLLTCLREDLKSDSRHFQFHLFTLPRVEVCTSVIFSLQSLADSFRSFPVIDLKQKEPVSNVLFHLIPSASDTKLVIGYLAEFEKNTRPRIAHFEQLPTEHLLKEVSDILIKSCETWACSGAFYEKNIRWREGEIIRLMNYFVRQKQFSAEKVPINLFHEI